jgi:hypothetical protein
MKLIKFGSIINKDGNLIFSNFIIDGENRPESGHEGILLLAIEALENELRKIKTNWILTSEGMPENLRIVLAFRNSEIVRAQWVGKFSLRAAPDSDQFEYNEEDGEYYSPKGWYECVSPCDDYDHLYISDPVTHWMPLPANPVI